MRIVQNVLLSIVPAVLLNGCSTLGAPADTTVDTAPSEETALSVAYRQLQGAPHGGSASVVLPDGFGSGAGVTVVKRYLAASGKRCTVVAEARSGERRTLCRNNNGETNAFSSPDNIMPR